MLAAPQGLGPWTVQYLSWGARNCNPELFVDDGGGLHFAWVEDVWGAANEFGDTVLYRRGEGAAEAVVASPHDPFTKVH